jgi:hypothetical protein
MAVLLAELGLAGMYGQRGKNRGGKGDERVLCSSSWSLSLVPQLNGP